MTRVATIRMLLAVCAVFVCDRGAAAQTQLAASRDSAGVTISEVATGAGAAHICTVNANPMVRIGELDGADPYLFQNIEDLAWLSDGRIAVLDRGSQELRLFGPDGSFQRSMGRAGGGPGEFRDPIEVEVLEGDSLAVWDWSLGRVSVFSADGGFGRSVGLQPPMTNPTGQFEALVSPSEFVVSSHRFRPPAGERLTPQELALVRFDRDGNEIDTAAVLPYGSLKVLSTGSRLVGRPMFEARGVWTSDAHRLYSAAGDRPEVRIGDRDGRVLRILRWIPISLAVTAADVTARQELELADLPEASRPERRRRHEVLPVQESFPALEEIRIGADQTVWVKQYDRPRESVHEWLGFNQSGDLTCALRSPGAFRAFEFQAASVLGVFTDELGVQYVEVRQLEH